MTSTLLIYMCLGQKVWELILQAVRTDDLQTLDHIPGACAQSDETIRFQRGVEVCGAAHVLTVSCAVRPVGGVQFTRLCSQIRADLTAFLNEMTEPVVLSLISCNGIGDTLGERKFETQVDCLLRALDHPFHNGFASVFAEVLGVVFNVAVALDLCLERDNNQSAPDTGVLRTHLGQVVGP